jgi:ABC-type nitrate/sulfonate/bicarbonate transport system permease component
MPLTTISYKLYNTIHLWWLIAAMNNLNPINVPTPGTVFIVIRREYLQNILQAIKQA